MEGNLPKLKDIKYPDDFVSPEMTVASDETINRLMSELLAGHDTVGTGDALIMLVDTGYVEVYKKIAECEVLWNDDTASYER